MPAFILLALLGLTFHALAEPYPPVSVPVKAVQVGTHSYYVPGLTGAASAENQGFMSNAGFIITDEGVVVFDTLGSPSLAWAMLERIREITQKPIKIAIVSHYHADHYYGAQVFTDAGAELWAHEQARGVLGSEDARLRYVQRQESLGEWISPATQRFPEPDVWIAGDTDFKLGGLHFKLRHVGPAHSAEDLALFVEDDGVLYAGDLVFKGRIPFVGEADSGLWLAALDKLLALRPRVLVPGHGIATETPEEDLLLTRDYLIFLRERMGQAVADMVPFEEAYEAVDWGRFESLPAFSEANRVNAYNTYLLMEREAFR